MLVNLKIELVVVVVAGVVEVVEEMNLEFQFFVEEQAYFLGCSEKNPWMIQKYIF